MMPTDAQVKLYWLTAPQPAGPEALQDCSERLTCVRKLKRVHLMDASMGDLLSERISTASYKIHEQTRRTY